jgi:hypothetical protein
MGMVEYMPTIKKGKLEAQQVWFAVKELWERGWNKKLDLGRIQGKESKK